MHENMVLISNVTEPVKRNNIYFRKLALQSLTQITCTKSKVNPIINLQSKV